MEASKEHSLEILPPQMRSAPQVLTLGLQLQALALPPVPHWSDNKQPWQAGTEQQPQKRQGGPRDLSEQRDSSQTVPSMEYKSKT